MDKYLQPKIGVAIAAFNSLDIIKESLNALLSGTWPNLYVVVLDSGSTDGTFEMLLNEFPDVTAIRGNGELWWSAGTNEAIKKCLEANCDYIAIQNPDVIVQSDTIEKLYSISCSHPYSIIAPVVVDYDNPKVVWWAGSKWEKVFPSIPFLWTSRYFYKNGTPVSRLPDQPYLTSEVHGRTVLVAKEIFQKIGLYDEEMFPHYSADTDFSFRAAKHGVTSYIAPNVHVRLLTKNTGMKVPDTFKHAFVGYWNFLTKRKNGELLFVWWKLLNRHLPRFSAICTFIFVVLLNTYRYWSRALDHKRLL